MDEEWALVRPVILRAKRGGNKRTVDVRELVNGLMYVLSMGCQWASIPKDLPPRSTVDHYFCRWTYDGTLDRLLPPYAPELNPVERIWLFLRERYLSHRLHADYNAIVDAACHAWRQLTPGRLKSLCAYPWIAQVIS